MNQIKVIAPYKHHGMWVFDDPSVGLTQEPFVGGADTIIDAMTRGIPDAPTGFVLLFSAHEFPGHQYRFEWIRSEGSGNVYHSAYLNLEGWLCPALLRYFESPPHKLFIQVRPA